MAKKQRPEPAGDSWMNTYADMVTLLLCFFVLLYSMSVLDAEKWQRFASAFKEYGRSPDDIVIIAEPGAEDGTPIPEEEGEPNVTEEDVDIYTTMPEDFDQLYAYLQAYVEEHGMEDAVQLTRGEHTVYVRFNNNIFFSPDSAELLYSSYEVLDFLGNCLASVEDQIYLININGHTASVDYEFYPVSSWTLSGERATNIAIYFEEQKGIDARRLRPIGYSDTYPVAPNDTDENRRQNRRVDMVIVSDEALTSMQGGLLGELAGLYDPDSFPTEGGLSDLLIPGYDDYTASNAPIDTDALSPPEPQPEN